MANGHSGGDSVGIDNHVGIDTLSSEGQVLLPISDSASSLLSMSTGKLVSNHGDLNSSHLNLDVPYFILISC